MLFPAQQIFICIKNDFIVEEMIISSEHFYTLTCSFHLSNHRCIIINKQIYVSVALYIHTRKNYFKTIFQGFFYKIILEWPCLTVNDPWITWT